jgi:hypothetical protein
MPEDISRLTFRKTRHYSSVRQQQGRVQVDADWNEQSDIIAHRIETEAIDVVGPCGIPQGQAGFALQPQGNNLLISSGRCYVDGILCENEAAVLFTEQRDLPGERFPTTDGVYLAYLDVWQRPITALEDPAIREVALGGPDTATRLQTVWQVRLLALANSVLTADPCHQTFPEWDKLTATRTVRLAARAEPAPPGDTLCVVPPGAGYRRLENQLYRVEIHTPGTVGSATFKWSRDNGSIVSAIDTIAGNVITVRDPGHDALQAFAPGQWVEILDDGRELYGQPGAMARLIAPTAGTELTFDPATVINGPIDQTAFPTARTPKVRRWDHATSAATLPTDANFVPLEDGVEVRFTAGDHYETGDYWLLPARTATGLIEWPEDNAGTPLPQERLGIVHHYCRLALVSRAARQISVRDCREHFDNLTELTRRSIAVSSGRVIFRDMKGLGEIRQSPPIKHGLQERHIAIVLALEFGSEDPQDKNGFRVIGDTDAFPPPTLESPLLWAVHSNATPDQFVITLQDRRPFGRTENPPPSVTFIVRWWALPKTLEQGDINVPPPTSQELPFPDDFLVGRIAMRPGIRSADLADELKVSPDNLAAPLTRLESAGRIRNTQGRLFPA